MGACYHEKCSGCRQHAGDNGVAICRQGLMDACYHEKCSGCRQHAGGNGVAICR